MATRHMVACFAALALAAGCTIPPSVVVANHSGSSLRIVYDDSRTAGDQNKERTILPGEARKFYSADLLQGAYENGAIRVLIGKCLVTYRLPDMPWYRGWNEPPLPLQVEPDLAVYLKKPGRKPTPSAELEALQPPGFPIAPEKTCPAD